MTDTIIEQVETGWRVTYHDDRGVRIRKSFGWFDQAVDFVKELLPEIVNQERVS